MYYLATNPFCPYCYVNDRITEKRFNDLDDNNILLLPMNLAPDLGEFNLEQYHYYESRFNKDTLPYIHKHGLNDAKFFKFENVGPSKIVFLSYYYLRTFNLGLKFYHIVTKRFFENDFNFSDINTLASVVKELGANVDDYLNHVYDEVYDLEFQKNMNLVDEYETEVVPTYILDNSLYPGIEKAHAKLTSDGIK